MVDNWRRVWFGEGKKGKVPGASLLRRNEAVTIDKEDRTRKKDEVMLTCQLHGLVLEKLDERWEAQKEVIEKLSEDHEKDIAALTKKVDDNMKQINEGIYPRVQKLEIAFARWAGVAVCVVVIAQLLPYAVKLFEWLEKGKVVGHAAGVP